MPLNADEIRQRKFDVGRRGYDRDSVDRFRSEVAETVEELSRTIADFEGKLGQLGIDELPDLGEELSRVATDVGRILEDARQAATEMRRRAEEDASRWRAEAETEAAEWRAQAEGEAAAQRAAAAGEADLSRATGQHQAEEMRGAAWAESAAMIQRAKADADDLVTDATQDAMFIRAGAERDSLRLTGTARQDAEAELKDARAEAERLIREAEQESSRLMEDARQARDHAADEVRTLDQRRIELLVDVDAIQRAFDHMDVELEARLNPRPVVEDQQPAEWEIDPAVKVVPASRILTPGPVDADELMAEVARLREEGEAADAPSDGRPSEEDAQPGLTEVAIDREDLADLPFTERVTDDEEQTVSAVPSEFDGPSAGADVIELVRPDAEVIELPIDRAGEAQVENLEVELPKVEFSDAPEPTLEPEPTPEAPAPGSALDNLFASLRTAGDQEPPVEQTESAPAVALEIVIEPDPPVAEAAPSLVDPGEAAEMRARLLLPAENEALRSVKRGIVDLQNRALAELHDHPAGWSPDRGAAAVFAAPAVLLVDTAYAAGHAAAGELVGRVAPVPVSGTAPLPTVDLDAELSTQLADAHRRAVAVGAGQKETAAAVSRVFRAWRMDESERRLHAVAWSAFHHGVLSGLGMLGVERVATVADARGCVDCAARAPGDWDPSGPPPAGWVMPPAHTGCVVSIVPASADL